MSDTVLIVPGYHGSGPAHWQSWLESRMPESRRVTGIDWEKPVLADWSLSVRHAIETSVGNVWIVAHSFGCLASVVAVADRPDKVAGMLLVAPANPERFSPSGLREQRPGAAGRSIAELLPRHPLPLSGLVIASQNDPYLGFADAQYWAKRWGLAFRP